jgi:hypothetical protein
VQRHASDAHAALLEFVEHRALQMQAGGRRRDRAGTRRIHGLIAFGIGRCRAARDVRWQRHCAVALEHVGDACVQEAQSVELLVAPEHLDAHVRADQQDTARHGRMAGAHQGERLVCIENALDKDFDAPTRALAGGKACLDDPGVVDHEHVAPTHERRKVCKAEIIEVTACGVEVHQPARRANFRGVLRDQLFGKRIVCDAHGAAL